MTYREALAADRRLVILRLLAESGGYRANEFLLHSALERFGHAVSMDTVRGDLQWLQEQEMLTVDAVADMRIAALTQRGLDVGRGTAQHPGVARPRPGE